MIEYIDKNYCPEIEVSLDEDGDVKLKQRPDTIYIDKRQAVVLVEILQDWLGELWRNT